MKQKITYSELLDNFSNHKFVAELNKLLSGKNKIIRIKTLSGSLKSFTLAALNLNSQKNFILVTSSRNETEDFLHDLELLCPKNSTNWLEMPAKHLHSHMDSDFEHNAFPIEGLAKLLQGSGRIGVCTPDIFTLEVPQPEEINQNYNELRKGSLVEREELIRDLLLNGFERRDFVGLPGELAVRGGIIDIFPPGSSNPFRIEFFGNEIESIREFNPISQRSIRENQSFKFLSKVFHGGNIETMGSVFNYFERDTIFIFDSQDSYNKTAEITTEFENFRQIIINPLGEVDIKISSVIQPGFQSSIKKTTTEIRRLSALEHKILISADGRIHLDRLRELIENSLENLVEEDIEESPLILADAGTAMRSVNWLEKTLSQGFISEEIKLAFFTEHQIFNRLRINDSGRNKRAAGITLREIKQLNIGDYIVHSDKGIGKFDGFEKVNFSGSLQDCVRLIFADGDKLYVNLNYIHKIQKYSAEEGVQPRLSKLGSSEWLRKKERTKKKLKDIARDLINLYAQRKMQPGYSFPADSIWQKEFEASFIYEDTPDQARSTDEVKKDMESASPMDRLICGDVGFGKTEIAVRAAFKAAQTGKQIAVLVPTTILAQQHHLTFKDRLNNYPVVIESISRFKNKAEQSEILRKLKSGGIDILIGTHRLLSKDIGFKDLGLLIIDEEHRFGVGAKEKLRQLRHTIDTLTLTATPIPRTLNFSLMGARDLSIIETPPRNRLPINTDIIEWDEKIISGAINYEIERKGQVFFVTDKVEDIHKVSHKLQLLLPDIRLGIAHGQMPSKELENVMEKFISGKFDLLVTTKIVESGLDIPNANTMFVNRAQNFGLAELYQLRGRVGRSNTQAFCYLIIPPVKILGTSTLRRLQALEEFTALGSGFQLALRDMEIRGAGNLLGPEQSGYINEIGYELYHKILDEAVSEIRAEEFGDLFKNKELLKKSLFNNDDITIVLDTDALLPTEYIPSETERFKFYKKLYNVRSFEELKSVKEEIGDRFGKLPTEAEELIFAVRVRLAAIDTGFTKINITPGKLSAEFPESSNKVYYELAFPLAAEYFQELENSRIYEYKNKLFLEMKVQSRNEVVEILWRLKKTLDSLDV